MSQSNDLQNKTIFGFWVYLMTDLIMFGVLFASYAVLHTNTFGGPSPKELFSLPGALTETLILLISSFTCGLAMLAAHRGKKNLVLGWFALTAALGIAFLALELTEFSHLIADGHSFRSSASPVVNKLVRLSMYWHFLDLVWIFIFTIVYLMGAA
jgi:cytochrome o ubiquinol oxidase subunit 3